MSPRGAGDVAKEPSGCPDLAGGTVDGGLRAGSRLLHRGGVIGRQQGVFLRVDGLAAPGGGEAGGSSPVVVAVGALGRGIEVGELGNRQRPLDRGIGLDVLGESDRALLLDGAVEAAVGGGVLAGDEALLQGGGLALLHLGAALLARAVVDESPQLELVVDAGVGVGPGGVRTVGANVEQVVGAGPALVVLMGAGHVPVEPDQ